MIAELEIGQGKLKDSTHSFCPAICVCHRGRGPLPW
jgi:hypothetical protein